MARRPKFTDDTTVVTSQRYPSKLIAKKPIQFTTMADWHIACLKGDGKLDLHPETSITPEQKESLQFFYNLFMRLFQDGKLDKEIEANPDIMEKAEKYEEVLKP